MAELGFTMAIALAAVSIGVAFATYRLVLRHTDRPTARLVAAGFAAKLTGTAIYYVGLTSWFGGGDADGYYLAGGALVPALRSGTLPEQAGQTGTPFMEFLTAIVLAVSANSKPAAYLAFSMVAFVGMVLFLLALRIAVPEANHHRYTILLLFLPSMLFWASNLGKDSWMIFTLGVATYGSARVLRRERAGYVMTALGLAGAYMVRPHMAALLGASLAFAFLLRLGDLTIRRSIAAWVFGLVVIATGGGYVSANWATDLRVDDDATASSVLEDTEAMTQEGGSEFDGRPVRSPGDLLHAIVTVPFRPFPTEAHNVIALLASLEGLLLLGLVVTSLPRLRSVARNSLRRPYVALCTVYCAGFIVAFASINNFGILARQRTQMLPFLLVLLALPLTRERLAGGPPRVRSRGQRASPIMVVQTDSDAPSESVSSDEPR